MKIQLNIGEEGQHLYEDLPETSRHKVNLKDSETLKLKKGSKPQVNLKEEIKFKGEQNSGRISIVGQLPRSKQGLGRAPVIFAAVFVIFILNLGQLVFVGKTKGGEAMALAGEAVHSLKDAGTALVNGEPGSESIYLTTAGQKFAEAKEKADFLLSHQSNWLGEPKQVESLRGLIESGEKITEVAEHLSAARQAFAALPEEGSLTDYIRYQSEAHLEPALTKLGEINALLKTVDLSGTEYFQPFLEFRENLAGITEALSLWNEAKEPLLTMLGDRYPQHYLILLMNNDEPRPGGGFIGNIGLLELNDGRIEERSFHDVYDYDDRFFDELPHPLHELSGLSEFWRLRDSNTSADFPTSAQQAMWLFDQEGGQGVDGVIAVNLSAAQTLLETTGPITLPSYGRALSAADFPAVMSTLVEAKVAGPQPKSILNEFIESFISNIDQNPAVRAEIGLALLDEVRKKQVLFYHQDESVKELLSSMDLDASIPKLGEVEGDFFMPLFTSMGANKTERYMKTTIAHDTNILNDGAILSSLTIRREHTFNEATLAWLKDKAADFGFDAWNSDLEALLGAGVNRTGVRLYLPEGVRILDVSGDVYRDDFQFKYDKVNDISYYFLDQSIPAGRTQTYTIHYALPWVHLGDFKEYDFTAFKQPGFKNINFEKTVSSQTQDLLSSQPQPTGKRENTDFVYQGPFNKDLTLKLLFK